MRTVTAEQARSINGGYMIYQCKRCGWRIMVGWIVASAHITKYAIKPLRCPHCHCLASWKKI